jgi:serine/threonine protein kinase
VLLDLGIAKGVSEGPSTTTQAGRVRGTPAYMAPERFYGTPASEQSDLYELALVYYMMLLGRLPWADGADPSARHHPAAPVNAGFAKSLSDALLDALSVDAKRRPPSVRAFARRIERATKEQQLASETTAAQPVVDAPAPVPVDEPVPSRGAVTPDNTPPGASAIKAQEQEPPRWRAPLFAALGAAALATIPWLWTSQRQAEQLASMTTALERTSSAQPVEPHDALPPPVPSDVQAAPKAETTAAEATPSAVASAVEPPARPAVSVAPPPPSTQPSGPGAPAASLNVQPLGPEGAPPPPAPWCDRYISLWCSPDAKAWSPTGCATARSVVAKNGKIFARLPNKSSHDRICKRQYEAQKGFVTEGIAGHKERMAKRKEQK